jgi:hypothetical protein
MVYDHDVLQIPGIKKCRTRFREGRIEIEYDP